MMDVERARNLVESYSGQLATMRLLARGVSPVVMHPIDAERVDVSTPQTQALLFLNMMPYFVVLVVFAGGMYVIVDSTAGERERGSLEPLLINPVTRSEFVLGKLLASLPFAAGVTALNLLAFALAFNLFPVEDYIGFPMSLNVVALGGIFLIAIPMMILASAIQMIIASFTRSFKEAQTYTGFLPLIPAIPGMALAFLPIKASIPLMLIPTFGQQIIINQLMRGEPVNMTHVLVTSLATLALAFVAIFGAMRMYRQERIILGGK
jgi:sodium transport system permease protein